MSPLSEIWAANLVRSPLRSRSMTLPLLAPLPLTQFSADAPFSALVPLRSHVLLISWRAHWLPGRRDRSRWAARKSIKLGRRSNIININVNESNPLGEKMSYLICLSCLHQQVKNYKTYLTRKGGNYSNVLPLKTARLDGHSNLFQLGLQIWAPDKPTAVELVEIWRSSDKNKFAVFLRHGVFLY